MDIKRMNLCFLGMPLFCARYGSKCTRFISPVQQAAAVKEEEICDRCSKRFDLARPRQLLRPPVAETTLLHDCEVHISHQYYLTRVVDVDNFFIPIAVRSTP
ncbi:hypothetical protein RRG08_024972 [Elysia crispata]|uniref:Uncharacterized protein n=1 Tax=Elysia crispata TaxID=231223 RepID=A0AAE1E3K5_9GAST|nr:hypothetical protein RRG08_024972 [Elysia crispata]